MLFSKVTHSKQFAGKRLLFRQYQSHNTTAVQVAQQGGQNLPSAVQQDSGKKSSGAPIMRIMIFLGIVTYVCAGVAKAINPHMP
jgi:hypothetical protein